MVLAVFLSGYYPTLWVPPLKPSRVSAEGTLNNEQKAEIIASSFSQPVTLPHPGYLSGRFSNSHPGIDLAAGLGMPVHPITQGIVDEVNLSIWGLGNHVTVSHPNSFKSLYGHLSRVFTKKGQEVTTQTLLGEVGMTGFSSGPHTHLEITHNGEYIDPLLILPEISTIQSLPPKQ